LYFFPLPQGQGALRPIFTYRLLVKGLRNNKFAIFSVEAPVWQGAKAQEYQAYSEL
jgi:hypothetical protein